MKQPTVSVFHCRLKLTKQSMSC